jgi:hypothetical protein
MKRSCLNHIDVREHVQDVHISLKLNVSNSLYILLRLN